MASEKCTAILLGILAVISSCTDAQYFYPTASRYPLGDIREGSDVTFTCQINGFENPDISKWIEWQYKRDYSASSTSLTQPIRVTDSHNLTLSGVSGDQIGYYRCRGNIYWSQGYWSPDRSSFWSALPLVNYRPFIISENRTWIGANDNNTTTLYCYLQSKPRPDITWYGPNGAILTENTAHDRFLWENRYEELSDDIGYKTTSTLTIQQVNTTTDYGVYMCRATNGIGSFVDHGIELKETGAPEAPWAFETTSVNGSSIGVRWLPGYDGGEALDYFHLNIREIPGDFNASGWISRDWLQFGQWKYNDLQPDIAYQIAVYATNQLGPSPYATLDVRTAPASPNDLGISVSYTRSSGRLVVTGIHTGKGTCLRLEGKEEHYNLWYPLGQDLYCIERDGVFEYLGPYSDNMRCYYCRDSLCSLYSYVAFDWELFVTKSPLEPVLEGSDVSLTSVFASPLKGWIEWRHSRDRERSTTVTEPTFAGSADTLTLSGLFRNRTGWYRCAGNTVGPSDGGWNANRLSDWTAVQAIYGPDIINKDRTWIGANQNYTAFLKCVIQGNPLPSVTWYGPDDAPLSDETIPDRIALDDIILGDAVNGFKVDSYVVFASVDVSTDYGTYMCRANSSIGSRPTFDNHEIQLKGTGTPEPPKQFQVFSLYSSIISVEWDPGYDGGEELEYHFINFRKIPEEFDPLTWIRLTSYSSYGYLSNLHYDTLYQVAVYATNRLGSSPYATVTTRTKPGNPHDLGISVSYSSAKCKFAVTGIPQDDDPATCLKIGRDYNDWVSLGPELDCIQSDGEFAYCGNFTTYYSRYCRDDVCSDYSYVSQESSPSDPNGPQIPSAVIVCVFVFGFLGLMLLALGVRKCYTAKASPPGAATANGPQINASSAAGMYTPTVDAPPTYTQAVELDVTADKNEEEPPPGYPTVLPQGTPHATSNATEDQV